MVKGEVINGYTILQDFVVAGGMSKVSFAKKGGKEYFIKEFLSPKYPVEGSPGSERVKAQKRATCDRFVKHHMELNRKIATKVSFGGNLVFAVDFFRCGTCFYKITEKVDTASFSCEEISRLSFDSILLIARCACHSLKIMHSLDIVHGDLKPDNILIKKTSGGYAAKLIDFDDSYFSENPPEHENLVGTPEYYSPEQAAYIMDEDGDIDGKILTLKSDIFTLGIILCEYFTGQKPICGTSYKTTWAGVNAGIVPRFAKKIPKEIEELLSKMILKDPAKRPSIEEVFDVLKKLDLKVEDVSKTPTEPSRMGGLRGKGLGVNKKEKSDTSKLRGKGLTI